MTELVKYFIKSGEGRTRDAVPNLYALIGYIASLPKYALKALFPANMPGIQYFNPPTFVTYKNPVQSILW